MRVPGYDVQVGDVTGAGGTFGGALVYAIERSPDLSSALEFAVAAASRAVTIEGPQGGIAPGQSLNSFVQEKHAEKQSMRRVVCSDLYGRLLRLTVTL